MVGFNRSIMHPTDSLAIARAHSVPCVAGQCWCARLVQEAESTSKWKNGNRCWVPATRLAGLGFVSPNSVQPGSIATKTPLEEGSAAPILCSPDRARPFFKRKGGSIVKFLCFTLPVR